MLKVRAPQGDFKLRMFVATGVMLLSLLFLGGVLFRLQVVNELVYRQGQDKQSVRAVRLPGVRGHIFDRNEICMADNKPVYDIVIYPEEVRQRGWSATANHVLSIATNISRVIDRPLELDYKAVTRHMRGKLSLPLVLYDDLSTDELARWAEQASDIEGVDVLTSGARVYPFGATAAHALGYVRSDRQTNEVYSLDWDFNYYLPDIVGKSGLEKAFDPFLQGKAGGRLLRINVAGYKFEELSYKPPTKGGDLKLSLDLEIQQLTEMALGDDPGAAVVVDPNNGDVLALVSSPTFDPNDFYPRLSSRVWNSLRDNRDHPMQNKAVAGLFPPGSTFKPITAMAALQQKPAESLEERGCEGRFRLGRSKPMKCWNWRSGGHGNISLEEAIKYSCNVYMFKMGLETGMQPIYDMAEAMGIGQKTGIEVDKELAGLLPSKAWKKERRGQPWTDGDTCNMSIGQGFLLVTPLQMAMVSATIANGGYLYKPRLIKATRQPGAEEFVETPVVTRNRMNWLPESLEVVRRGMWGVINASDGTAKKARIDGWAVAAKTGTAEVSRGKKNVWMIAFAPYEAPRYAVAMMVDRGGVSGGSTIGPKLKVLMQGLYELEQRRDEEASHAG
ncbi:penicillin-binding protein 2 [Verrucomicrobiota bacterium]